MFSKLSNLTISECGAPVAAGSAIDSNSDRLDMAGYEGVIFIATIEDSVATGVAGLKVEQNSIDSDTGMALLAGTTVTKTCTVNDDINGTLLIVEVFQPRERYVQAVRTSATANIAFGTLLAIRYGRKKLPITADATVSASASVASPAEA
jgi:hypothetical protein